MNLLNYIYGGLDTMSKFKCNSCGKEAEAEEAPQCCDAAMVAVTEESGEAAQENTAVPTEENAEETASTEEAPAAEEKTA